MENPISSMGRMAKHSPTGLGGHGQFKTTHDNAVTNDLSSWSVKENPISRKFYFLDRSKSVGDPDTTFLTVPNVPLLTAFDKIRNMNWLTKPIGKNMIMAQGRGTPFINVSFSGLLWG